MTLFVLPLANKAVTQDLRLANVPVVEWNAFASFDVTIIIYRNDYCNIWGSNVEVVKYPT
jgi:hypothetical protein